MSILLLLLLAHIIADFYLQPLPWLTCRRQKHWHSPGLLKHIGVHVLLGALALLLAGVPLIPALFALGVITLSHYLIDVWKSYQNNAFRYFVIDQCLHVLIILLMWVLLTDQLALIKLLLAPKYLGLIGAYILAARPASIAVAMALTPYAKQIEEQQGLEQAGKWIGYIERWLIISFVLMGQYTGIGFLLAAKSVFRIGDLTRHKDHKITEYMLLGSLYSVATALAIGQLARLLYNA